jgi:hypothetical protein
VKWDKGRLTAQNGPAVLASISILIIVEGQAFAAIWVPYTLLPVNAAIQSFKQLCGSDGEGVTDAQQGRERDGSSRLNLLPMAGGKAKPDHVFLGEAAGFAQLLYPLTEDTKELFLIDQACLLSD